MPASWRGALAWGLMAAGAPLAAALALAGGGAGGWTGPAAWVLAAMLAAATAAAWLEAREAARVRRELALGLAHRVRTPLTHIRLFNEMLILGRENSDEERQQWLHLIDREAEHLGDMAESVLLLAQEPGALTFPVRRPTDLGALLEDVAAAYAPDATSRGMLLVAEPAAGVVAAIEPRGVRQAVVNLVQNALDYGPAGQTIRLSAHAEPGRAVIVVTDQGPGVPRGDRKRVWKPFVRLGLTEGGEPGRGLGLTVVRLVARAHDGCACVEDAPGGGACFRVTLPAGGGR